MEETMSRTQVLLSVMDKNDTLHYVDMLNIRSDVLIVNQCGNRNVYQSAGRFGKIYVRESDRRGLSISRNEAMQYASSDTVIFSDNDVRYEDDAFKKTDEAFERYPNAAVLCFFIERPERHEPVYEKETVMDKVHMMKIFSPEIAVRRSLLGDLRLNEEFGAGAKYSMGEENIFLFEAKRRGLEIRYIPEKIASLLPGQSTWFKGYDERFFFDRGAGYYAMDSSMWQMLALQFIIRKRKLYRDDISPAKAYRSMKEGRREYRKTHEQK